MRLVGIEIGGTKLQIAVGNERGEIDSIVSRAVNVENGAVEIRRVIENTLVSLGTVDGVGVGFGGPVDWVTGEVWTSFQVAGWTGVNLRSWLQGLVNAPVAIDNDANVAALAEATVGVARGQRVVFYTTLGSGVGGGLVVEGRVYHGAIPGELEFGHVRLDMEGKTVESSCSGWAVNQKVVTYSNLHPESQLAIAALRYRGVEAMALIPAIDAGDDGARTIVEATAHDLGFGLSHVVHLLHPDMIVLGGGLSLMGEYFRNLVSVGLEHHLMKAFKGAPVRLSELKANVVPVGALVLIGQEIKK